MDPPTKIPRYSKATLAEIKALEELVKKLPRGERATIPVPLGAPAPVDNTSSIFDKEKELKEKVHKQSIEHGDLFKGGIAHVSITREAIRCDNPVQWLLWLMPELEPYQWQFETLLQASGYLTPGKYGPSDKTAITKEQPFLFAGPMANGSGKDFVLIAGFATWYAVVKARNRVVITSASHEQIKYQTEPHIRNLCNLANGKFGMLFKSKEFHHIVPELGSEIKLYVTDEAGRAEGYHAFHGGGLALVLNEAKSIKEDINTATERYTGLTHRLEFSSPGQKSGFYYDNVTDEHTVHYPAPAILGTYYTRKVTAYDCPHITQSSIQRKIYKYGADSALVRSSIEAEFTDHDEPVVITEYEYDQWANSTIEARGEDIGIGLDIAAGGDEDACFVRKGNRVIHKFFFRQQNVMLAADLIDMQLMPWKEMKYSFRADNGGVGMGCIDRLTELGWRVIRTNNQSPAHDKRGFLNLGAEMWFHLKRLLARKDIVPAELKLVSLLKRQLTTRYWKGMESTQGKYALESKIEAKAAGRPSPDRADALVLCFASYRPSINIRVAPPKQNLMTAAQILQTYSYRGIPMPLIKPAVVGISTLLNKSLH